MYENSAERDEGRSQPENRIGEGTGFTLEVVTSGEEWRTIAAGKILQNASDQYRVHWLVHVIHSNIHPESILICFNIAAHKIVRRVRTLRLLAGRLVETWRAATHYYISLSDVFANQTYPIS